VPGDETNVSLALFGYPAEVAWRTETLRGASKHRITVA
jgi:hypothetical protein